VTPEAEQGMSVTSWKLVLARLCPAPFRRLLYKWATGDPFNETQRAVINTLLQNDTENLEILSGLTTSIAERLKGCDNRGWAAHTEIAALAALLLHKGLITHEELEKVRSILAAQRAVDEATDPAYEGLREVQRQLEELNRQQDELRRRQEEWKRRRGEGS